MIPSMPMPHLTDTTRRLADYLAAGGRRSDNPYGIQEKSAEPEEIDLGRAELEERLALTELSDEDISSVELSEEECRQIYGEHYDENEMDEEVQKAVDETVEAKSAELEITELEAFRSRVNKEIWDTEKRAKELPRLVLGVLIQDLNSPQDDKIALVNEFILSIEPYTMKGRDIARSKTRRFDSIRKLCGEAAGIFETEFDDFTLCQWTRIYGLVRNNPAIRLDEKTKSYIFGRLMPLSGPDFEDIIPSTDSRAIKPFLSTVKKAGYNVTEKGILNSENHVLMLNSSTYIKNYFAGLMSNDDTELQVGLAAFLDRIYEKGLEEFNSIPYAGYTIEALLNLYDFLPDGELIQQKAKKALDKVFYDYAIHSTHDGKSFRPFARLNAKVKNQDFIKDDSVRPIMEVLLGKDPSYYLQHKNSRNVTFAFTALTTRYVLPDVIRDLANDKEGSCFAITGQPHGNVEISYKSSYSITETDTNGKISAIGLEEEKSTVTKTRQYILSGGGMCRYKGLSEVVKSFTNQTGFVQLFMSDAAVDDAEVYMKRFAAEVVSRNITLILDGSEGPSELKQTFFLGAENAIKKGPGIESNGRNNSGIYYDVAVGACKVHVPDLYKGKGIAPNASDINEHATKGWRLYEINSGLRVAVFDAKVPCKVKSNRVTKKRMASWATFGAMDSGKSGLFEIKDKQVGIMLIIPGEMPSVQLQSLINDIARANQTVCTPENKLAETPVAYINSSVTFPDAGSSVIKGFHVTFNLESALDRYVFGSINGQEIPLENRLIYPTVVRKSDKHEATQASGWSAHSVVQRTPDEPPVYCLEPESPEKNVNYAFLQVTNPAPHEKLGIEESQAVSQSL